ncbi:hypothetical protein D1AOALGA4SA_4733 [Olavius algarvensis Delta 1 endosymbiont]|nr:hypothetical protein D1AOALGA4SA_4733 [Olavius algarvensis Delta 1 endosymbiont]
MKASSNNENHGIKSNWEINESHWIIQEGINPMPVRLKN